MKRIIVFLLVLVNFNAAQRPINELIKICPRNDPDLNDCLKESIQSCLAKIGDGIPELGVPSLDPHKQKEVVIEYSRNQISGKAVMKNLRSYGLSKAKVLDVRANIRDDSFYMEIDMSNEESSAEGFVKGGGRLNAFTFENKHYGYFNHTMSGLTWTWKLTGVPEKRDDKTYVRITKFFMRPEVQDMMVSLPPVFGDNKDLNKLATDFANNNWRLVYRELLPVIQLTWDKIGSKESNRFFLKIPYDELFPM